MPPAPACSPASGERLQLPQPTSHSKAQGQRFRRARPASHGARPAPGLPTPPRLSPQAWPGRASPSGSRTTATPSPCPRACTHSSSCRALCSVRGRSGTRLSPPPARACGESKQRDNLAPKSPPPQPPLSPAASGPLPAEGWKPEKSCQSPGSRCEAAAAIAAAAAGDAGLRAPGLRAPASSRSSGRGVWRRGCPAAAAGGPGGPAVQRRGERAPRCPGSLGAEGGRQVSGLGL